MVQKKWKYAKEKKKMDFEEYFIMPLDEKFKIKLKNWTFSEASVDGYTKTVFRTDVVEINGKTTDKRLVIKNYDNVQELKKRLGKKTSARDSAELEISRHEDEENMEYYFEIKFL
jgi:hypothetical protein